MMSRQRLQVCLYLNGKQTNLSPRLHQPMMWTGLIQLFSLQFMCKKLWCSYHLKKKGCSWPIHSEVLLLKLKIQSDCHKWFLSSLFSNSAVRALFLRSPFIKQHLCWLLQVWIWTALAELPLSSHAPFLASPMLCLCCCQRWYWTSGMETLGELTSLALHNKDRYGIY